MLDVVAQAKTVAAPSAITKETVLLQVRQMYSSTTSYYFGGARSKGFATLRNVSKLQFFDKVGHAKSVGFRFHSAI